MASISGSSSSKNDYLKKYLSNDKPKKKKVKAKSGPIGMKILEDDAFIAVSSKAKNDTDESSDDNELNKAVKAKLKTATNAKFKDDTFEIVEEIIRNPGNQAADFKWKEIKKEANEEDESPSRRKRHDSNASDQSPPRRKRYDSSASDQSPPRRKFSPVINRSLRDDDSPRLKRRRHDSSSDNSPIRKKKVLEERKKSPYRRKESSPRRKEKSPVRLIKKETKNPSRNRDSSPPRRRQRHDSSPDMSPIRRRASKSPISGKIKKELQTPSPEPSSSRFKTLDGKKAGLVNAREMIEEARLLKEKERKAMDNMDDEITGRGAATKVRTSAYKKKGSKEDVERKEREARKNEELKEKYETWNKGLSQIQERKDQLIEMERTINEGFARYADDNSLNEHLKEQLYMEDDPMASVIAKKRQKVREMHSTVYPTYQGHWAPNRFSIQPGYRWDGVDRSNGFESKMALTENKRKAQEEHTYRSILECGD